MTERQVWLFPWLGLKGTAILRVCEFVSFKSASFRAKELRVCELRLY
jgi:hypothetical protein